MRQLIQKMEREWYLDEKELRDLKRGQKNETRPKTETRPKNMTGRRDMKKTVTAGGGEAFKHLLPERQPQKPRGIRTSGPLSTRTAGGGRKTYTYYVPWMKYEENVPQGQGNLNQVNEPYFDFESYNSSDSSSSWTPPPKVVKKKKKSKSRRKQVSYEDSDDDATSDEGSVYEEPSPLPKQVKKKKSSKGRRRKTNSYEDISHDGSLYGGSIYEKVDGPESFQNKQRYAGYQRNAPYMNSLRSNRQNAKQNNQRYNFDESNGRYDFSARSYESDEGQSQEA